MTDSPEDEAFDKVCNYLSFRQRTEHEIRRYLSQRDLSDLSDPVLKRLKKAGLVDDERFASTWVAERSVNKGYGRHRLLNELKRLGIDTDLIERTLEKSYNEEDESSRALKLAQKRLKSLKNGNAKDKRQKTYAFLIRKGYSSSVAVEAIESVMQTED